MGFLALELGKDNESVGKLTEKMEKAMFKDNNDNNNTNNQTDVKSVYGEILHDESFVEIIKNKFRLNI